MEETRLVFCIDALCVEICKAGGLDMVSIERLFSEMRALGLKMPYQQEVYERCFFFSFLVTLTHTSRALSILRFGEMHYGGRSRDKMV